MNRTPLSIAEKRSLKVDQEELFYYMIDLPKLKEIVFHGGDILKGRVKSQGEKSKNKLIMQSMYMV